MFPSFPLEFSSDFNLLLARFHQADIIIVGHLIRGRLIHSEYFSWNIRFDALRCVCRYAATRLPNLFCSFHFDVELRCGNAIKTRDIKELYLHNFYHFIARYQKMFEITLTTEMRQCTFDCYIIEQLACLNQASKFYTALTQASTGMICNGNRIAAYRQTYC